MFWRLQAQRLLVERGQKDLVPQLVALVRNKTVDEIGTNGGRAACVVDAARLGETGDDLTEAYRAAVEALSTRQPACARPPRWCCRRTTRPLTRLSPRI
jgi:hypothetical protein